MTVHRMRMVISGTYEIDDTSEDHEGAYGTMDPWEMGRIDSAADAAADPTALLGYADEVSVACYPADARRLSYTADEVQHLDVHARLIFQAALDEGRAGELLATVYEGGVAYLTDDGRLGLTTDHKD